MASTQVIPILTEFDSFFNEADLNEVRLIGEGSTNTVGVRGQSFWDGFSP